MLFPFIKFNYQNNEINQCCSSGVNLFREYSVSIQSLLSKFRNRKKRRVGWSPNLCCYGVTKLVNIMECSRRNLLINWRDLPSYCCRGISSLGFKKLEWGNWISSEMAWNGHWIRARNILWINHCATVTWFLNLTDCYCWFWYYLKWKWFGIALNLIYVCICWLIWWFHKCLTKVVLQRCQLSM